MALSSSSILAKSPAHQIDPPPSAQVAILHRSGERQGLAIHPLDVGVAEIVGYQRLADEAQMRRSAVLLHDAGEHDFVGVERLADDLPGIFRRGLRSVRYAVGQAKA